MSTQPPTDPAATAAENAYLDRLRAADPAATASPDMDALRAAVSARAAADADPLGVRDDLAARRRSRFGWPARAAAAAAAVVVVGSGAFAGGYAVGASPEESAAPAIQLGGPAGVSEGPAGVEAGAAAGGLAGMGTSQDEARSSFGGWWGRVVFTSSGLSTDGGSAQAWGLDPSVGFSQDAAVAAASVLGLEGTPELVYGSWQIGSNDGTGPMLTLSPDGQGTLSFYDPTKDPWWCGEVVYEEAPEVEPSADEGTTSVAPGEPSCTEQDLGPAPAGDAVASQLREVLVALGIDVSGYEVVVEDYGDPQRAYASAYQVVDGQRTGLTWSASMTGAGLASLYGSTAALVPLGEYEVISPAEAVARLGDPRFGVTGGYPMMAERTVDEGVATEIAPEPWPSSDPTLPPVPQAGQSFAWPVSTVQITSARLGLALTWQHDGSVVLLPSYELTGSDGSVWSVVAVSESALDFTAAG
ncbi:hypothetical protein [Actinotalea sp.]|uniref:hypothetical protein n=1 Tax=Actinotalea sp. TaxID=1872145 RepID=UPI0035633CEB